MGKKKLIEQDLFGGEHVAAYPVIKKGREKLSAAQSKFNRLNKKIETLRDSIRELPERELIIKTFYAEQAASLFDEEKELTMQLLERLDAVYEGQAKLTKKEKALLPELFLKEVEYIDRFELSDEQQQRVEELKNKYLDISSGMTVEEREKDSVKFALEFCSMMGVKPNAKMKRAKTEAEFEEALLEHLLKQREKELLKEEQKKKAAPEPKEKKLSKREIKQKLQEEQTMRSIREIYIELVKELHPDKETDEKKRALKEERMKQLTKAYQAKDLASLLRMQIEWLEESAISPETQTDDVLKRYNKLLQSQLDRLEEEYELMCNAPFPGVLGSYGGFRRYKLSELKRKLDDMLATHIIELDRFKEYVAFSLEQKGLKSILKEFGHEQALKQKEEDGWNDFIDLFLR